MTAQGNTGLWGSRLLFIVSVIILGWSLWWKPSAGHRSGSGRRDWTCLSSSFQRRRRPSRPRSYQISCPGPSVCKAALLKPRGQSQVQWLLQNWTSSTLHGYKAVFLRRLLLNREAGVAASHRTVLFLCRRAGLWESRKWWRLLFFC